MAATVNPVDRQPCSPCAGRSPAVMLLLVLIGLCGAGCYQLHWDGGGWVTANVRVTDAKLGTPIAGVAVSQAGPFQSRTAATDPPILTDAGGAASLQAMAGMGGIENCCIKTTDVWPSSIILRLQKDGYRTIEVPLSDEPGLKTSAKVFGIGPRPSFGRDVRMTPVPTATD